MDNNTTERIWELMARQLSGEASKVEMAELELLLRERSQENYSMEILQDLWKTKNADHGHYNENQYKALVGRLRSMGIDEKMFGHDDHHISEAPKKRRRPWTWVLTSSIALLIIGAIIFIPNKKAATLASVEVAGENTVVTKNGSKTNMLLPDGTKVWLNAGSKITYLKNYGVGSREISLSGEAFFDVVHNAAKPFVIHTGKMDIKVLGTAFNVKCYPGDRTTETSLIRGSIEVTLNGRKEKIMLKPNEKLIVNNEEARQQKDASGPAEQEQETAPVLSIVHVTHEPISNDILETSWVANRLVFSNETFDEVAIKMERWYNVNINIQSPALKIKRFTGSFENETVEEALTALRYTLKFNFSIDKQNIIISQ